MPTSTDPELVVTDAACTGFSRGRRFRLEVRVSIINGNPVSRVSDSDEDRNPTWTGPIRM